MSRHPHTHMTILGEKLILLPERGVFWESAGTLVVADLHLGKASASRASGVPIPAGSTNATLHRLDRALQQTEACRLIILGDFWHHPAGNPSAAETFQNWRKSWRDIEVLLIPGNHDKSLDSLAGMNLQIGAERVHEPPFVWRHEPVNASAESEKSGYVLCGHLHPGIRLNGPGLDRIRLPCFHFTKNIGIIPAFGEMTGLSMIRPQKGDRVFAVAEERVLEIPRQTS